MTNTARETSTTPALAALIRQIAQTARTLGHDEAVLADLDAGVEVDGHGGPFAREHVGADLDGLRAKLNQLLDQAGATPAGVAA